MPRTSHVLTLVIHGTYAAQEEWWRLGPADFPTFADQLETELASRGLAGSVWTPALDAGLDYSSFSWTGMNRHRDRVKGAKQLGASLNELARRVGATRDQPLTVNFVAHSHGGNVVLESLNRLNATVRVGSIALLGTPLITTTPAFFLGRIALTTLMLLLIFLSVTLVGIELGTLAVTGHWLDGTPEAGQPAFSGGLLLLFLLPMIIGYGWAFWLLGDLFDVAWRVVCRVAEPLAWLQGTSRSLAYGPSSARLSAILRGRPMLLLTSHNDEADVLLQLGSAPSRLYREYVEEKFSSVGRPLERVLLRPIVLILLRSLEVFLAIVALGFSPWRALWFDHDVALEGQPYYQPTLLVHERADIRPRIGGSLGALDMQARPVARAAINLRGSIDQVVDEIMDQVRLRHSAYYQDKTVHQRVASFLINPEIGSRAGTASTTSSWASGPLWEAVLLASVTLALLIAWISKSAPPAFPVLVVMGAYMSTFTGVAVVRVANKIRQHPLAHPHVIVWSFWVLWALAALAIALGPAQGMSAG